MLSKEERKARRRANRRLKYSPIGLKNKYGHSDYTPYSAINGIEAIPHVDFKNFILKGGNR